MDRQKVPHEVIEVELTEEFFARAERIAYERSLKNTGRKNSNGYDAGGSSIKTGEEARAHEAESILLELAVASYLGSIKPSEDFMIAHLAGKSLPVSDHKRYGGHIPDVAVIDLPSSNDSILPEVFPGIQGEVVADVEVKKINASGGDLSKKVLGHAGAIKRHQLGDGKVQVVGQVIDGVAYLAGWYELNENTFRRAAVPFYAKKDDGANDRRARVAQLNPMSDIHWALFQAALTVDDLVSF
jgi:hypothetical protein